MKRIIIAAMLWIPCAAAAQDAPPLQPLSIGGVPGLLADKIKEAKACGVVSFNGKPGAGSYLPIWTWHDSKNSYAEFPAIGYRAIVGEKPRAFLTATANLPGISDGLFGSQWFKDHVTKSQFPPIFFGPALMVPLDLQTVQSIRLKDDWQKYVAVVFSIGIK